MNNTNRLSALDACRGYAVLAVVLVHTSYIAHLPNGFFSNIVGNGQAGVQLFYIISAFTLFFSMERKHAEPIKFFFIRRFFRIVPMFYFALAYYMMGHSVGLNRCYCWGDQFNISFYNVLSHFLFFNSFSLYWINSIIGVEWSVAIEVVFYVFVPLLYYKFVKTIKHAWLYFLSSAVLMLLMNKMLSPISFSGKMQGLWGDYLYMYLPAQLPVFFIGILLFFIYKKYNTVNIKIAYVLLYTSILLIIVLTQLQIVFKYLWFSCAFAVLIYSLLVSQFSILVNRFVIYLGKISYSMYLVHWAVIYSFTNRALWKLNLETHPCTQFFVSLLITLTLTLIVSSTTYRFIEQPFINMGSRTINRIKSTEV